MPLRNPISPTSTIVCSILVWIAFYFWWISNKLIGIWFGIGFHLSSFPRSLQSLTWKPSPSLGRHWARSLWPHTWVCKTCTTCTSCTICTNCTNYKTWNCTIRKSCTNGKACSCQLLPFLMLSKYTLSPPSSLVLESCAMDQESALPAILFSMEFYRLDWICCPQNLSAFWDVATITLIIKVWFCPLTSEGARPEIHLLCNFTISANDPFHFSDPFKVTGLVLGIEPLTRLKSWVYLGWNFYAKKIQNDQSKCVILNTKTNIRIQR